MSQDVKPKSSRKEFRQYIQTPGMSKPYLIGRDNTDLSVEQSWNEKDEKNVLGEQTSTNTISGVSTSVDPFFVRKDDELGLYLLDQYSRQAELDDIKATYYEACIDDEGETIFANKQDCMILVQSVGGDAEDGINIPFTIKRVMKPVPQNYVFASETFSDKP